LVLLASLLLATAALVRAMPEVESSVDDSSSLSDGAVRAHAAVAAVRHSTTRPIYAAPLDRGNPPVSILATTSLREVDEVSASPAHLRSGPTSVSERGPPPFART
jgi:hypothetical protein